VVERREEGHALPVQRPVYFISEVLSETKIRYPQIQKLLYTVILTQRKLRHYFESHPVTVVSSFPLGEIIQCWEASGRIAKWAVEIMGETILFAPRKAIKSQVLADFVAEWVDTQLPAAPIQPELWTMFFDGALMKTGAGAGLLFISPLGKHLRYVLRFHFPTSNNVAEYEEAPRALVGNAFRQGFYRPTAVVDATRIVRTCQGCQFYARQTHLPTQALQTIPITWPFAVWGLDLLGPLQRAPGGYTHLLVAIDKFSKWIEVRPLNSIGSEQAVVFFTNIIHRFGVPNSIITDNGTQFTGRKFLDFCEDHHIRVHWAAVAHPMTNG
jgi:hypothetical protein